ncbi:MAG: hypothetical protein ABJ239_08180 [Erythrobacter sp.]
MNNFIGLKKWRFHLGVHKTATTHLQEVLYSQKERLAEQGIDYIPTADLRSATRDVFHKRYFRRTRVRMNIRSKLPVTILSEENWLGDAKDGCMQVMYPGLERRLRAVFRPHSVAFLAVRHPADFASSLYAEALRHHPSMVSSKETKHAFLNRENIWLQLVLRVKEIFPETYVWRYEDYRANAEQYISLLAGTKLSVPKIPDPIATKRLSAEAVKHIEQLNAATGPVANLAEPADIPSADKFQLFDDAERAHLSIGYSHDLSELERMGILLLPD